MESRFNRIDGTAPLIDAAESKNVSVPKSVFDFGRSVAGPMEIGALYPVDCFDTIPSERIDIDFTGLVDVLQPTIQKLINGFDVYVHAYYNRESDLWEGSKNFTTKGRSGQITASIPRIDPFMIQNDTSASTSTYAITDTVGSLFDWLGCQPNIGDVSGTPPVFTPYWDTSLGSRYSFMPHSQNWSSSSPTSFGTHPSFINAIPFFMYQRLWRDKYAPKNLLQSNKNLFPDNEDHFIIPYSAARFNVVDYTADSGSSTFTYNVSVSNPDLRSNALNILTGSTTPVMCDRLRFRQYKGDDFTTASPFPELIRGSIPDLSDFLNPSSSNVVTLQDGSYKNTYAQSVNNARNWFPYFSSNVTQTGGTENPLVVQNNSVLSHVTVQSLVALNAYNIFAERMGRTNGDYDSMIKAQFGFDPQNQSREARYLGGLHFSLGNNEIQQTSESSVNSPLGETVVRSQGSGSGRLASFTSPDYGYIMVILSIVPNTWYADGQEAYLNQQYQTDRYFPIFEKLGPEAIKNKELKITGSAIVDDNVFGYAERGYRYKSRRNAVRGLFRARENQVLDMSARVTARRFTSNPALNMAFTTITPSNFDHSIFAFPSECPFYFAGNIGVRRIAPMSEYTAPAGFTPASM